MEININIAGEELNSKRAAKQLHLMAEMVRAGVLEMSGFSIEFMGAFDLEVDLESNGTPEHADYWDGEHNHLHVDHEGIIISRQGPDAEDGTPDVEQMHDKRITIAEWSKAHGGITPFGTPEAESGDHTHEH